MSPYYLMRYERELASIDGDEGRTAQLVAECLEFRMRLGEATLGEGDMLLYEELTELVIRVSDYLTQAYEALQTKVRTAMGGEVLELLNDRAKRLEREAEARGEKRGEKRGFEQGTADLAGLLRERGVEAEILDEAMEVLRVKREQDAEAEDAEGIGEAPVAEE